MVDFLRLIACIEYPLFNCCPQLFAHMKMNSLNLSLLIFNLILSLSAYYVGRRLIHPQWLGGLRFMLWCVVFGVAFSLPASFVFRRYWLTLGHVWVIQLLQYAMGLYSIVLFMTVARDVLLFIAHAIERFIARQQKRATNFQTYAAYEQQLKRRDFLRESSRWGAFALTSGAFGRAAVDANSMQPTVVRVDVPIRNLPQALDGVRIVQISDLHVGQIRHEARLVSAVVQAVNALDADIIALTESKIVTVKGDALRKASDACRMHFYQSFLEVLAGRLALANARLAAF